MKKLILAIAASAYAMSAYAANPDPIDLKVQLAGKVPRPDIFVVKPRGEWDGENKTLTVPDDWDWSGKGGNEMAELQWDVKSSYGPVHLKLRSPLQGKDVSTEGRGVLVHDSGDDFVELDGNITSAKGGWRNWGWVNYEDGGEVLMAESAARGDWVGVRLRLYAPNRVPRSGTYTGTMTAIFETGMAS
ncbi:hypothetical protein [Burkholderia latens]|uniref:Uncharacterized protein n=1 Tax=Burkholderia latens TaxID=488446 RepID=A0A6H9SV01_9BURK|nr:hypothetical protein [Burkholderia latens]KAB0643432.1 hypothetical protein F7R21_07055 [Burkholderia latens]VWB13479.1 hypothetical protein BLA24064_00458 [Burkholderia latens]